MKDNTGPRILVFDIETAPMLGYIWSLWDQNVAINQLHKDWHVLSWAAKWRGDPDSKIMYMDQRNAKNIEDDREILGGIWKLLDEADILLTQNGKAFDVKKLNARFAIQGFEPPSGYKHIDTKEMAKKHFGFTSNRLDYLTDKLCKKYKKDGHKKFAGFELWQQCLAGNKEAWNEMEKYNKLDVLSTEELADKLLPWDSRINFNLYSDGIVTRCTCGSTDFRKRGFFFTNVGKFQRYRCLACGAETRDRESLFSVKKKKSLRTGTVR